MGMCDCLGYRSILVLSRKYLVYFDVKSVILSYRYSLILREVWNLTNLFFVRNFSELLLVFSRYLEIKKKPQISNSISQNCRLDKRFSTSLFSKFLFEAQIRKTLFQICANFRSNNFFKNF